MNNPYRQYQKTAVTTASKEKILLMLYEGAIRFTRQAKAALNEKRIADKGKFVSKATAILSELMATLDFKAGGDLAADLENLYVFMIDKLIEGNIQNSVESFDHVEKILLTLYSAWKDVIENPRPDGVPSPKLQPDEYKKYQSERSQQAETGNSPVEEAPHQPVNPSGKPNLKIIA